MWEKVKICSKLVSKLAIWKMFQDLLLTLVNMLCWNQGDDRWNRGSKNPPRCRMDWSGNNLWRSNILTRKESWERPTSNFCKCQFVPLNGCFGSEIVFEIDQQKRVDFWTFGHLDPNVKQLRKVFCISELSKHLFGMLQNLRHTPKNEHIIWAWK